MALGIPFGVVGGRLLREEAQTRLAREAVAVARAIDEQADRGVLPPQRRLARLISPGRRVTVTGPAGTVTAGNLDGDEVVGATTRTGRLRVTVAESADIAEHEIHTLWLMIAAAGVGALIVAGALAGWQARRLARPLERLADVSRRLGQGDLAARAGAQEIPEMDAVARALDHSAEEIGRLVERERAFSSNVAHQLRSPLTALDMRLEELAAHPDPAVRTEADAALEQSARLRRTTDDLLELARHGRAGELDDLDVARLVGDRVQAWTPAVAAAGRRLVRRPGSGRTVARAPRAAVEQALDVLVENALRHGRGDITVTTSAHGGAVHVDVEDDGDIPADDAPERVFASRAARGGIGLSLARALLEAGGGRLSLACAVPTRFEIVLPPAEDDIPA